MRAGVRPAAFDLPHGEQQALRQGIGLLGFTGRHGAGRAGWFRM
jgi:hypothetical protein